MTRAAAQTTPRRFLSILATVSGSLPLGICFSLDRPDIQGIWEIGPVSEENRCPDSGTMFLFETAMFQNEKLIFLVVACGPAGHLAGKKWPKTVARKGVPARWFRSRATIGRSTWAGPLLVRNDENRPTGRKFPSMKLKAKNRNFDFSWLRAPLTVPRR